MPVGRRARQAGLIAHVATSVGWMGAVAVFLALAVTGLASPDPDRARAAYIALGVAMPTVVVPLAIAALATGVTQSLVSPWGLFRHYWVVVKLVVTVAATLVLLQQRAPVAFLADAATTGTLASGSHRTARLSLVVHAGGGLAVLAAPLVLSVVKPRGVTRYGHRKQRATGQQATFSSTE